MGQRHPLTKLRHYPGFLPQDQAIWERFLDSDHPDLLTAEYNVHVGPGVNAPSHFTPNLRKMATKITQMRIDVIVRSAATAYIVEIKPRAGATALGQALTYAYLYRAEYSPIETVQPVVLTDGLIPGVEPAYALHSVAVWLVH